MNLKDLILLLTAITILGCIILFVIDYLRYYRVKIIFKTAKVRVKEFKCFEEDNRAFETFYRVEKKSGRFWKTVYVTKSITAALSYPAAKSSL